MTYVVDIGICSPGGPVTNQAFLSELVKIFFVHIINLHDNSNVNESLHHGGPRIKDTLVRKRDSGVILFMAVLIMILFNCYFVVI